MNQHIQQQSELDQATIQMDERRPIPSAPPMLSWLENMSTNSKYLSLFLLCISPISYCMLHEYFTFHYEASYV